LCGGHCREYAAQDVDRCRRTARDGDIDRQHVADPAAAGITLTENAAGTAAVAHGDNELGRRRGIVGAPDRHLHVAGNRSGDQQQVSMAWTGDKADAESLDVVVRVVERVDFEFAAVA